MTRRCRHNDTEMRALTGVPWRLGFMCRICWLAANDPEYNVAPGLGDMIAAVTSAVGIKPCKACKKRQAWLNKVGRFLRITK